MEPVRVHRAYPATPRMRRARSPTAEREQRPPAAGRGAAKGCGATSELGDTSRPDCGGNALGVTADLAHVSDAVSFAWRMVPSLRVQVDGLPLRVALASGPLLLVRLGKWGAWPVYTRV